jgi:hypothetical protein
MDDCGQYSTESDCSTDANNYGCIWDSTAGSYIITWNAYQFPSGIYFIYLQAGKQIDIQKVTLLK